MSLRRRSHVKASMVLTRAYHLFIVNYIRSLLNIILRPIIMVRTALLLCVCHLSQLSYTGSFIYIYYYNNYLRDFFSILFCCLYYICIDFS